MKKIILTVMAIILLFPMGVTAKHNMHNAVAVSMKTAIHKIEKPVKKKKVKKTTGRWESLGDIRITSYCPACNDPAGSYQSTSGKRLKEGMVACNWLENGTVLKIDGRRYVVRDTCGTEAIDLFIDTDECYCSLNEYKEVKIWRK